MRRHYYASYDGEYILLPGATSLQEAVDMAIDRIQAGRWHEPGETDPVHLEVLVACREATEIVDSTRFYLTLYPQGKGGVR